MLRLGAAEEGPPQGGGPAGRWPRRALRSELGFVRLRRRRQERQKRPLSSGWWSQVSVFTFLKVRVSHPVGGTEPGCARRWFRRGRSGPTLTDETSAVRGRRVCAAGCGLGALRPPSACSPTRDRVSSREPGQAGVGAGDRHLPSWRPLCPSGTLPRRSPLVDSRLHLLFISHPPRYSPSR